MNICLLTNFNKINEGYADLGCSNKLKYGTRTMRAWLVSKMLFLNNSVHLSNEYSNIFRLLFLEQAIWVKKISLTSLRRSSNSSGQELMQSCKEADLWNSWAACFQFFLRTTESPLLLYSNGDCIHNWDLAQEHCGCNLSPSVCHWNFL